MELPHRFPFRFVDRTGRDSVRLELTANGFWLRGVAPFPAALCAELIAQAAAVLLAGEAPPEGGGRELWLAGIEGLELERELAAGETLEVRVRPEARFGRMMKVAGEIYSGAERVGRASLLLA